MRYTQYKGVVEREYKKSLRKIMHDLCIVEQVNAAEGARRLGVAKSIFEYWRNFYDYDPRQRLFDQKVQEINQMHFLYVKEPASKKNQMKNEPLVDGGSLEGFRRQVESLTSYYRTVQNERGNLAVETANLQLFEFVEELVQRYQSGELQIEAHIKTMDNEKGK